MPKREEFERALEKATGKSIEYLRDTPIDEQRREVEARLGKRLAFASSYIPLVSHEAAEAAYRDSVRQR